MPQPPWPTTLSTVPSINQVPRDPWLAGLCRIHRAQESTSPGCRHSGHCCLEGERLIHTPSCRTAISWIRMKLLGKGRGCWGEGPRHLNLDKAGGGGRTPRVLLRIRLQAAQLHPLPNPCLFGYPCLVVVSHQQLCPHCSPDGRAVAGGSW